VTPFPKPTLPQRWTPLICIFKHTISWLSIFLFLLRISEDLESCGEPQVIPVSCRHPIRKKYVITFDIRLVCVLVSLKVCQICSKQLTSWSRVILEKLTVSQLDKKFPVLYGSQMIISVFSSVSHWSVFRATSFQSTTSHSVSSTFCILILLSVLSLPGGLFSSFFPPKLYITFCSLQQALHALTEQIK
jgi:hypothetical protein